MSINHRIKDLRKRLGMTQKRLGECLGLTATGICDIESGKVKQVTEGNIKLVCKLFNVSEEWLREGVGEPFNNQYENRNDLSEAEKDLLKKFNALDVSDRKAVCTIIDGLYANVDKK